MAKFDFDKPVASFSWYLQNGSADDKRGNRLHVGTGQKAQIYFDPESGEFIGKLKYVDDYIDLADGAKQHFELPRTAREYKPSDFSPKFPISNVKFEVDESVKDFIHVLPRGLFFCQNEFYDPVHGIYIESKVNGMGDVPHFTLYDVSVADIEECMAWGIKHLDEVPRQIHVVNGSPHIATIYTTGPDDRRIYDLIYTLCEDGRWCDVSELNAETLARFNEVIAKADRIEAGIVKDDEWRDGMVEQVSGFMDKIKDMDAEEAEGADTVLAEKFNSMDALSTDAAIDLLQVYSSCDASGRDAVAKTFYALSGESFDSYLMTASEVCKKTLGMLEPEPPQPAKAKNLSQKTASSREASTRLSDEIGAKPCTRDEGTVGDS